MLVKFKFCSIGLLRRRTEGDGREGGGGGWGWAGRRGQGGEGVREGEGSRPGSSHRIVRVCVSGLDVHGLVVSRLSTAVIRPHIDHHEVTNHSNI